MSQPVNSEAPLSLPPPRHIALQPGQPPGSRPWLVLEQAYRLLGDGEYLVTAEFHTRAEAVAHLHEPVHFLVRHPRLGWCDNAGGHAPDPAGAAWLPEAMALDLAAPTPGAAPLQVFALLGTGTLQPWPASALRLAALQASREASQQAARHA